jgi:molybdenum cofactor biosynthesis enzyme MoaA
MVEVPVGVDQVRNGISAKTGKSLGNLRARYADTGIDEHLAIGIGFITPLTHNFCESCNRVRVTCTGTLYMCLGQEDAADLRGPLRGSPSDGPLYEAIAAAIQRKPKGHDFVIDRTTRNPAVSRHMSVTGG